MTVHRSPSNGQNVCQADLGQPLLPNEQSSHDRGSGTPRHAIAGADQKSSLDSTVGFFNYPWHRGANPQNCTDINAELEILLEKEEAEALEARRRTVDNAADPESFVALETGDKKPKTVCIDSLARMPGVMIGLVMNIMLSVPFGLAFFPQSWEPFPAPRAVGLQMFLLSTLICQVTMTIWSEFDCALGMMMVENIPFMHDLAQTVIDAQGTGLDALATTMTAFAISTLFIGGAFYFLGKYKLGRIVNYFPRHFIIGCIGGIGVFVTQTGFEVSTGDSWAWDADSALKWSQDPLLKLWLVSVILVVILNILLYFVRFSLMPPIYFIGIIPAFYVATFLSGTALDNAREGGWLFARPPETDFLALWSYYDMKLVRWDVILSTMPTMLALTCFGLMHAPINVPSLSMSVGIEVDMNEELVVHGRSNLISGLVGGLPNYLCYSNSLLYFKCNGGGRTSGLLLAGVLAVFFVKGPAMIAFVPRCMAGCLLIHVGLDLCRESLVDPLRTFDMYEYICVWLIAITMTVGGMTSGLVFGIVLSAVSFTLQQMSHSDPIRGTMPATTLRSTKTTRRSHEERRVIADGLRDVKVVQLQGTLFFGNATDLLLRVEKMLDDEKNTHTLILDFTLVRSLESSAAEAVAKIYPVARRHGVKLVYNRGSTDGFPTSAPLSPRLSELRAEQSTGLMLHISDELDDALAWTEDQLLTEAYAAHKLRPMSIPDRCEQDKRPLPERQLQKLCPDEEPQVVTRLFQCMERRDLHEEEVLWKQGSMGDYCLLLSEGLLQSVLEEEAGTNEDCNPGCLVGEYTFLKKEQRMSTVTAKRNSVI
eukprot:TRINITY_DN43950_c0_g1_i1.p1 TRINITY_DN43950_c0_g1~~TRINITY_DN43950_c0_g1_i1.p1  ORF type:complete len:821 (+),score=101.91 TRINITY_DN43950_c0_g1_i1:79-2541(+)